MTTPRRTKLVSVFLYLMVVMGLNGAEASVNNMEQVAAVDYQNCSVDTLLHAFPRRCGTTLMHVELPWDLCQSAYASQHSVPKGGGDGRDKSASPKDVFGSSDASERCPYSDLDAHHAEQSDVFLSAIAVLAIFMTVYFVGVGAVAFACMLALFIPEGVGTLARARERRRRWDVNTHRLKRGTSETGRSSPTRAWRTGGLQRRRPHARMNHEARRRRARRRWRLRARAPSCADRFRAAPRRLATSVGWCAAHLWR